MTDQQPTNASIVATSQRLIGGVPVGPLAFGLWRFTNPELSQATAIIEAALDAGMNLIDTADVYGLDYGGTGFGSVEALLGKVLAASPSLRARMVLATKGGIVPPVPYDSSPAALRDAIDASLRRLGVDHIDLYQIHRPDLLTHPAEVATTLTNAHQQGKIGMVGVSNHTPAQTRALSAHLSDTLPIVTSQPEFSAANLAPMRDGTFDLCAETGMVPLAWSPLGGGRLMTGEGVRPELIAVLDGLAAREEVDRSAICLAFVLAQPSRPVAIIGTQTPARIADAISASRVTLDRNDVYDIIEASEGVPLP